MYSCCCMETSCHTRGDLAKAKAKAMAASFQLTRATCTACPGSVLLSIEAKQLSWLGFPIGGINILMKYYNALNHSCVLMTSRCLMQISLKACPEISLYLAGSTYFIYIFGNLLQDSNNKSTRISLVCTQIKTTAAHSIIDNSSLPWRLHSMKPH
jgi:hypothetical protein